MLEFLRIRDVAIIDKAELNFGAGLNILSGETGAGKSIIIESISLLLGGRAHADLVRAGKDEAIVEGVFDLGRSHLSAEIRERLKSHGLENPDAKDGDSTLVIRRVVSRTGKNRIHLNGSPCTLTALQAVASDLVDICGQQEHQSLLRPAVQLALIDTFGGLTQDCQKLKNSFSDYQNLKKEIDTLEQKVRTKDRHLDFLRFQILEIKNAELVEDEDVLLQQEKQLLASSEARIRLASAALNFLCSENSENPGATTLVLDALSKIKNLIHLSPNDELEGISQFLDQANEALSSASVGLEKYQASCEHNEHRLAEVQERLALIASLKRKFTAGSVKELIEQHENLSQELSELEGMEGLLEEKRTELSKSCDNLQNLGAQLYKKRKSVSKVFSASITQELRELQMPHAVFEIRLEHLVHPDQWISGSPTTVDFFVQTNKGEEAKTAQKIASGGELSRLMLSVRHVISDRGGIGVYLFDEIDAGMSGQTAFVVGKKLGDVSRHNQVICITHLPQVAAFATKHFRVHKSLKGERTLAEVSDIKGEEQTKEVARMMGGIKLSKINLENAKDLIQTAHREMPAR